MGFFGKSSKPSAVSVEDVTKDVSVPKGQWVDEAGNETSNYGSFTQHTYRGVVQRTSGGQQFVGNQSICGKSVILGQDGEPVDFNDLQNESKKPGRHCGSCGNSSGYFEE
jgi:hypothetical protein